MPYLIKFNSIFLKAVNSDRSCQWTEKVIDAIQFTIQDFDLANAAVVEICNPLNRITAAPGVPKLTPQDFEVVWIDNQVSKKDDDLPF